MYDHVKNIRRMYVDERRLHDNPIRKQRVM